MGYRTLSNAQKYATIFYDNNNFNGFQSIFALFGRLMPAMMMRGG
jgi:hypothetical protein